MNADEMNVQVAIVGGGPSGASCAYWLARRNISTSIFEKKVFPREKTCGDGLTPRSVVQIEAMGMGPFLRTKHRYEGLRAVAYGREMELPWPTHPEFPTYGYTVTRSELDEAVAHNAVGAGAELLTHHEVVSADHTGTRINHLMVRDIDNDRVIKVTAEYYVLAEGATSRVSWSLGAERDKAEPLGLAIRGYYASPRHDEPWIESHMDLRSRTGAVMPGYGWIFPLGDGRVNVGFGLLTNSSRWKSINTTEAMEDFVTRAPSSWGLSEATALSKPTGGKLQMGHAVNPKVGSNFIVVGDAAGSINPFNGEGISYAMETGRLAADVLSEAIATAHPYLIYRYLDELNAQHATYYRVARRFVKLIGNPWIMGPAIWMAMRDPHLMNPIVKVMANLMKDQNKGAAEYAYAAATKVLLGV